MDNTDQVSKDLTRLRGAHDNCTHRIVAFTQGLVFTLRDAGREHTAKELERLLFELDALDGEIRELISRNPGVFLDMLRRDSGPKASKG